MAPRPPDARRIGEQGVAVEVLDDDPSTGPERGHEPPQDVAPLRQVLQDEPAVDEVEVRLGQRVGADVVPQGAEVRLFNDRPTEWALGTTRKENWAPRPPVARQKA
jgi:hypothetical protein